MKKVLLSLFILSCFTTCVWANSDPDREKYEITHTDQYKAVFSAIKNKISGITNKYNAHFKGLDSCAENGKYAKDFTIDRRCYMTDEQKQRHPYDAVVGIITNGWVSDYSMFESMSGDACTGVIVKNPNDSQLYIYTAAHCVSDMFPDLFAYSQNGYVIPITNIIKGGGKATNYQINDYAVFAVPQEYQAVLPYVETGQYTDKNVDIVGHGTLSILSDSAIRAAKQEWQKILKKHPDINETIFEQIKRYNEDTDFFSSDKQLKISFSCELVKVQDSNQAVQEKRNYCQVYGGNSGGPVFNFSGKLIGIVSYRYKKYGYGLFPYEGMKDVATFNNALTNYQKATNNKPSNIYDVKYKDSFQSHQKQDNKL